MDFMARFRNWLWIAMDAVVKNTKQKTSGQLGDCASEICMRDP